MKLRKKLITAVAMAAVCSTMVVPMVASASERVFIGCPPHDFIKRDMIYSTKTDTHEYLYGIVINEDGSKEYLYSTCTKTKDIVQYILECQACGMASIEEVESDWVHSANCGEE